MDGKMPDGKMPAKEGVDDDNDKARATRSMPRLDDTIDVALDKPMRLRKVEVRGLKHTRRWVVDEAVQPAMEARTFREILTEVERTCAKLQRLGIFRDMNAYVDMAPSYSTTSSSSSSGTGENDHLVDVTLSIVEKPRLFLKTGAEAGMNDGSVYVSAALRNVFGAGEQLEGNVSKGLRTKSCFQVNFTKPLHANPANTVEASVFQYEQDWLEQSSYVLGERGANVKWKTWSRFGHHELASTFNVRDIGHLRDHVSVSILRQSGLSTKCSIAHTFIRDFRNDNAMPTRGTLFKWGTELAGLGMGTGVQFLKNEGEVQGCLELGAGFSLSTTLRGGLLVPLDAKPTTLADRFFLGGPPSLRGFRTRGIGPRAPAIGDLHADAVGGDAFWAAGVSLLTPVPWLRQWDFVKGHAFVNAGALVPVDHNKPLEEIPQQLQHRFVTAPIVTTIGLGLCVRANFCRLEVNWVRPIAMSEVDQASSRVQVGIGMSFL